MSQSVKRATLNKILKSVTKADLAVQLKISRPTLNKILAGYDPHEGICLFINETANKILADIG